MPDKTTVIGKQHIPEIEEFKRLRWKYKEEKDIAYAKMLESNGWRRYALVAGELLETEDGYWAKNPNFEQQQKKEADLDFDRDHVSIRIGGGCILQQDGKYFDIKGKLKKNFKPPW